MTEMVTKRILKINEKFYRKLTISCIIAYNLDDRLLNPIFSLKFFKRNDLDIRILATETRE